MAGTGHHRLAIRMVAGCCALLVVAASGCANPTTAYHRQFEYLRRVGDEALAEGRVEDFGKRFSIQHFGSHKFLEFVEDGDVARDDAVTSTTRELVRIAATNSLACASC